MIKRNFFYPAVVFAAFMAFQSLSALPFNKNLDKEELEKIEKGEILIRRTGSVKKMCLQTENEKVKEALKEIVDLDPAYLAEVIQVRPVSENENILEKTNEILTDIPSYVGIPYWSERHKRYFDLYSDCDVKSHQKHGNSEQISAMLYMSPIGEIDMDISIVHEDDFYLYKSMNLNNLDYKGLKCISKENMKSVIIIYKDGDNWICYGIGGVEAPKIFLLKNRIEVSFLNRIKTFCNFVFEQL